MEHHRKISGMIPSSSTPFNFSQPGPSSTPAIQSYGMGHGQLYDDIPDVDADEKKFLKPSNALFRCHTSQGENINSSMSPTGSSSKISQRSGIKMEIPPYLDPDGDDDDPEEGAVYPDPDLFDVKSTNMTEYDLEVMKLGEQVVEEARKKIETPDASAPSNKIVEYLMFYRTLKESELLQLNAYRTKRNRLSLNLVKNNVDREFDQKACESLVKKLKDKKHDLQNLIDVVISRGEKYTGCITIPRTLDGRLQVHGRKGFPHVVYGKLWRFSEMSKNETRHVDHCKHAFEMKSDLVCVNPYHYELVVGTMIVGQRDGHDNRDLQQMNTPARFHTPNPIPSRQALDDSHRNSYVPISTPNINMMNSNIHQNMHQPVGNMPPIHSMAGGMPSIMSPNIHSNVTSNMHSNMPIRTQSSMQPNIHTNVHSNIHTNMNSNMISNINSNINPSITPKTELNMVPMMHSRLNSNTQSNMQPNMSLNTSQAMSSNMQPNMQPNMFTNMNSVRPNLNVHLNMSQDTNLNLTLHNHANMEQSIPPINPIGTMSQNYTSGHTTYHTDVSTSSNNSYSNSGAVDGQHVNFYLTPTQESNLYLFSNPFPASYQLHTLPQAEVTEKFVTLAKFRRFCKQRFGDKFYNGEYKDTIFPLYSGMTYVEAKETSPLGVEVLRRHLGENETLMEPFDKDLAYSDLCRFMFKLTTNEITTAEDEPATKEGDEHWGTVVYYEREIFVGEKECTNGNFYIDGGYLSSAHRFSIGLEPNADRSPSAFKIRRNIIEGIRFSHKSDGSVWIQNYMKWPVFVSSGYLDEQAGGYQLDKVHKLYGNSKLKVFGSQVTKDVIRDLLFSKKLASLFLQGQDTPMNNIYHVASPEDVKKEATRTADSLHRFCCVRVSFCKGFGPTYINHVNINQTPVWIELKVKAAYDYMNSILTHFGACYQPEGIEHFAKLGINISED